MLKINSNNRIKELEERVNDLAFEVIRLIQSNRDLKQQVKKNKDDLSGSKRELTKVKQKIENLTR
jgi:peptidoglycan hydrolase CwlO-like protein